MDAKLVDIIRIRSEVERLQLDGWEFVLAVPFDSLLKYYNGTGPENLRKEIREKLDKIAKQLLPAVMVHDLDFTWSDGTVKSFNEANKRLLKNCIICATDATPWYSWKRYALIAEAWTFYLACKKLGWVASLTQRPRGVVAPGGRWVQD